MRRGTCLLSITLMACAPGDSQGDASGETTATTQATDTGDTTGATDATSSSEDGSSTDTTSSTDATDTSSDETSATETDTSDTSDTSSETGTTAGDGDGDGDGDGGSGDGDGDGEPAMQWYPAQLVEMDENNDAQEPQVSMDGQGNAFVVWNQRTEGGDDAVFVSRYTLADGQMSLGQVLDSHDEQSMGQHTVAGGPSERSGAAWYRWSAGLTEIWTSIYDEQSSAWGQPVRVDNETDGMGLWPVPESPSIVSSANGNLVLTWLGENSNGWRSIWGSVSPIGTTTWSEEQDLWFGSSTVTDPFLAAGPQGEAFVTWTIGSAVSVARVQPTTGQWTDSEYVHQTPLTSSSRAKLTLDGAGDATVVWQQETDTVDDVYSRHYDASSQTWGDAVVVDDDDTYDSMFPWVDSDGSGNLVALYSQNLPSAQDDTWAAVGDPQGATWGDRQNLSDFFDGSSSNRLAAFATAPNGRSFALFRVLNDSSDWDLWCTRLEPGATAWTEPELIEDHLGDVRNDVAIAVGPEGNAVAVWQTGSGDDEDLWWADFR